MQKSTGIFPNPGIRTPQTLQFQTEHGDPTIWHRGFLFFDRLKDLKHCRRISVMIEERTAEEIAQRLDAILKERGWSTYRLTQECPAAKNSIYNVVKGRSSARIDTLAVICDTLDMSLKDFFSYQPGRSYSLSAAERMDIINLRKLDEASRQRVSAYIRGMLDAGACKER